MKNLTKILKKIIFKKQHILNP